jgi:ABC-type xylose transport system permease subunit
MIQHSLPRRLLHNHSGVVSIALFFVFCCVVFSLITSNFLTGTNWLNIIRQSAPLLIVATAMTLVITTGGIDLSVGSTLALVGALSAIALNNWGLPWPVVLLGGLLLGGLWAPSTASLLPMKAFRRLSSPSPPWPLFAASRCWSPRATRFRFRLTACLPLSDARGSSVSPCPR